MDIYQQLREARRRRKLSQQELSRLLGLPQSHLSKIEQNKIDVRLSTLIELARTLGLEPMLIPKTLMPYINTLLKGQNPDTTPLWQIDEIDEDTENG